MKPLELFPPQEKSKEHLLGVIKATGAALDASATGTGKTVKAVEIARELGLPTVVVCPKAIICSWKATFEKQGVPFLDIINYEKLRTGKPAYIQKIRKRFQWDSTQRFFVIFDEVHKCKGLYTQNASLLSSAKAAGFPILMLSASAIENPTNMRSIGYALGLHRLVDFFRWAQMHGCGFDAYNKLIFKGNPQIHLTKLNKTLFPAHGHLLSREDMGEYFSQTRIVTDPIDFGSNEELKRLCDELEAELQNLGEKEASDGDDVLPITRILRLRQRIELLKVPVIAKMVADYREEGSSVAVFLNFRDSVEALGKRLQEPFVRVEGGQSANARQQAIDAFQHNRVGVILANIAAGGVGISLHDEHGGHPRVSLISPTYAPTDLIQALGRIDRAGAQTDSVQRILLVEGTIEERVAKVVAQKIAGINIINQKPDTMPEATQLAEPEAAHAPYSPSSLKYIASCPGFRSKDDTNPAAEMGTRIHEALERDDFTGLSDFEISLADACSHAVQLILRNHGWADKPFTDIREVRLTMDLGNSSTFGTCDRLFTLDDEAIAVDYKTGRGSVDDAEVNWQAKAYTVGVFQRDPNIRKVTFYFTIPQRDEITKAVWRREDVEDLIHQLDRVISTAAHLRPLFESGQPFDVDLLNPQPRQCEYCGNIDRCPAVAAVGGNLAKRYADKDLGLPAIDEVHGSAISSPEMLARYMDIIPMLEKWASGIKHRAWQLVFEQGLELPGYHKASRRGSREITDPKVAWELIADTGVTMEDFLAVVGKIPINKYEDLVKGTAPKGQKSHKVKEVMGELFKKGALQSKPDSEYLARDK